MTFCDLLGERRRLATGFELSTGGELGIQRSERLRLGLICPFRDCTS